MRAPLLYYNCQKVQPRNFVLILEYNLAPLLTPVNLDAASSPKLPLPWSQGGCIKRSNIINSQSFP